MEGWKKDVLPSMTVKEAEYVYDYQWHSNLECSEYDSFSFAVACKDLPVHLLDSKTGHIICNYLYYNHVDEHTSAFSINFTNDKMNLICGYFKRIQVFDINRPGRISTRVDCQEQSGIISTIAAHPLLRNVFAAGSYLNSVGIYSLDTNKAMMILNGHTKGVTHVQFSNDGTKLFSGTRKDNDIICWDIRNPGNVLSVFRRDSTTNQRIYFDITPDDKYLISGSTKGHVLTWDIEETLNSAVTIDADCDSSFLAHNDCVNGVSVNPKYPLLATSSGQRNVTEVKEDISSSESDEEHSSKQPKENSVKLWWVCGSSEDTYIR